MSGMPKDVKQSLIDSGVNFDEHGNMIDEPIIKPEDFEDDQVEDQTDEDQNDDEDDDQDEDEDQDQSQDDDDDGDDEDDDDDDEEDDPAPAKKPKLTKKAIKKSLTPKETTPKIADDSSARILEKLESLQQEIKPNNGAPEPKPKAEATSTAADETIEALRKEANDFKKMRMQSLAQDLAREVDRRNADRGVTYQEIIGSNEWVTYLSTKKFGSTLDKFYVEAIQNSDWNTMLDFFDDFSNKYLPDAEKPEEKKPSKKLDDLAVPENSKSVKQTKRRSKYDFEADDYSKKLNEFERGKIDYAKFAEFEQKFDKALSAGRVKPQT